MRLERFIEILQEIKKDEQLDNEIKVFIKDSDGQLLAVEENDIFIDGDSDLVLHADYKRLV